LRVAFVGVERKYNELDPSYVWAFTHFHLEIPWYFAESGIDIVLTTPDYNEPQTSVGHGSLEHVSESVFKFSGGFGVKDAVVHWRKWRDDLSIDGVPNFVHLCDFNYGVSFVETMRSAAQKPCFAGVFAFRGWHKEQIEREMPFLSGRVITDIALGVDPELYRPTQKDRFKMLWASDPGRGLEGVVKLAGDLWKRDRRYKLHVCYPDYVKAPFSLSHPAIVVHRNLRNGPELGDLFNTSSFVPYTSTFPEPSSRVHTQGQAAGCVVLYPPNVGSPSSMIVDGETGYVRDVTSWADLIQGMDDETFQRVSRGARDHSLTQRWGVRATQFKALLKG
jgi:glycosyltransferase involved in cell wall biosynthesis